MHLDGDSTAIARWVLREHPLTQLLPRVIVPARCSAGALGVRSSHALTAGRHLAHTGLAALDEPAA